MPFRFHSPCDGEGNEDRITVVPCGYQTPEFSFFRITSTSRFVSSEVWIFFSMLRQALITVVWSVRERICAIACCESVVSYRHRYIATLRG